MGDETVKCHISLGRDLDDVHPTTKWKIAQACAQRNTGTLRVVAHPARPDVTCPSRTGASHLFRQRYRLNGTVIKPPTIAPDPGGACPQAEDWGTHLQLAPRPPARNTLVSPPIATLTTINSPTLRGHDLPRLPPRRCALRLREHAARPHRLGNLTPADPNRASGRIVALPRQRPSQHRLVPPAPSARECPWGPIDPTRRASA